ncbi:hypothetical protein [Endozoicomonas sp.]|uniref:hypothetical protein n=1 Tax=Endozoicomonas sp. TaxID=1892382 RepID=UPI00383AF393
MGLTGGVCGSLYFFGMAGTSPTPLGEVALWGSLTGTALLHGGKTFKTILDVSEQWPDFQKKNSVDKAKVVCKEVGASLIPFFGSLPESVLAYFGIYYRTGNVPLALIAACLSSAVRTNTFTALSKEMVGTLSESRMKALYGMTDNDIRLLIKKSNELNKLLIKAFDEEESAGVKARDRQMVVSEVDQLIGDRRLMRDIAKVIKHMAEKDSEVTVVDVREILKSSNVFARFSGAGKFSVTLISAVSIFMLTAEFMAARCLVSSASGDHFRLNDTSLFNQTAIDSYDNNFDCINYSQDVSFAWNTVCNIFGYGGAVSATILGQSLLSIINKAAKGVDNLYVALCDNDFIKEIQDVIFENWKIKLPAFMVSVALALCYRTMASSNLEYLEKLRDLEDCDIDGFGSYLPSIPKGGPIIVNAAFFTSFALYFIPLMMIFGLVSRACGKDHELHDGFSDELEEAVQDEVV